MKKTTRGGGTLEKRVKRSLSLLTRLERTPVRVSKRKLVRVAFEILWKQPRSRRLITHIEFHCDLFILSSIEFNHSRAQRDERFHTTESQL